MLDIFEILGPIMVGPSSSHTAGAVRIGRMARTLLGERPVRADIGLYGSFAETGRGHGTDRALVAGLLGMKPDDLRIPNSFAAAGEQGLEFTIHPVELREAHPNTAVLTVEGASGRKTCVQAASTGGGRIRVDQQRRSRGRQCVFRGFQARRGGRRVSRPGLRRACRRRKPRPGSRGRPLRFR